MIMFLGGRAIGRLAFPQGTSQKLEGGTGCWASVLLADRSQDPSRNDGVPAATSIPSEEAREMVCFRPDVSYR